MKVDPATEAALARRSVPAGTVVYAIGDIHGRADLLAELQGVIAADAPTRAATRRVIVYLGASVARGADSAGGIDMVMDRAPEGFETVALFGNHERLMLDFWADTMHGPVWLSNGGDATLRSYGVA